MLAFAVLGGLGFNGGGPSACVVLLRFVTGVLLALFVLGSSVCGAAAAGVAGRGFVTVWSVVLVGNAVVMLSVMCVVWCN